MTVRQAALAEDRSVRNRSAAITLVGVFLLCPDRRATLSKLYGWGYSGASASRTVAVRGSTRSSFSM